MEIRRVTERKEQYLDLLLLADEQESMIARYLARGDLFALYDDELKSVCVVTDEGDGVCELKSLATYPRFQGTGCATKLIAHMVTNYRGRFHTMMVGTGDCAGIVAFYEHRGFVLSHRVKGYFLEHYDHPMYEQGVQLVDAVYLKMDLR